MARSIALLATLLICSCEEFGAKCGPGTVERDHVCEALPPMKGPSCGPGTMLDGELCLPRTSTITELTCGPGTEREADTCVPIGLIPPGLERVLEYACPSDRCLASKIVDYWTNQVEIDAGTAWEDHDVVRVVTFTELGSTLVFRVTDEAGGTWDCIEGTRCDGLVFAAGIPVTLTLRNLAANLSPHTFTSPLFYRAVAWWKIDSVDSDYRASTYDSVDLKKGAADTEMNLYFVPMVAGEHPAYCSDGVTDGDRYAEIALGAVTPNYATGHAAAGMHTLITVEDPDALLTDVRFMQDTLPDRDPALDLDARRDPAWWTDPILLDVELVENSASSYEFRYRGNPVSDATPLPLIEGRAHSIRLLNRAENRRHTLTVPQLFARAVFLSVEDSQAEVRLPYPTGVGAKAGKESTLHLVPTLVAEYEAFCEVSVRYGLHGAPDFNTGHPRFGMHGPMVVIADTSSGAGN